MLMEGNNIMMFTFGMIVFMAAILALMIISMIAGYTMGKKVGRAEANLLIEPFTPTLWKPDKKEVPERDPWDEQRIDMPEPIPVVQTIQEEEHVGRT